MIKLKYLGLFIITWVVVSCNYDFTEDIDLAPITQGKVAKVFVGGNVECAQLNLVNPDFESMALTTGRNDFSGGVFSTAWPTGLEVEVMPDGSVSWAITPEFDLLGDGSCYKVGAAIVKGSAASNVYYYGADGATGDMGLFPPVNASGTPSALSNLTFCFVECKEEPKEAVIAVKLFYTAGPNYVVLPGYSAWASSDGTYIFGSSTDWCKYLGVNNYPAISTFSLLRQPYGIDPNWVNFRSNVGTATVWDDGGYLYVKVALQPGGILNRTYLYVGDLAGILGTGACPSYTTSWIFDGTSPYVIFKDSESVIFKVPY